jgi:hypothetical protein
MTFDRDCRLKVHTQSHTGDKPYTVKTRYKNVANKDLILEYTEDILVHRIT